MSVRLPIDQVSARFRFSVELEGVGYTFTFRWNNRDLAWFLDVGDGVGTPILTGLKVVINCLLLGRATSPLLPTGDFIAFDTEGRDEDAAFEDLGRRVQVSYFTREELDEIMG